MSADEKRIARTHSIAVVAWIITVLIAALLFNWAEYSASLRESRRLENQCERTSTQDLGTHIKTTLVCYHKKEK